jgi:hypothetical protein
VVYGNGLENRRTCKRTVSSNLTFSAVGPVHWGGARVDDWGCLLSSYAREGIAGSNPVLPAT